MKEYSVTPDAILSVGTELNAGHFVPGQYVDVTATSYVETYFDFQWTAADIVGSERGSRV